MQAPQEIIHNNLLQHHTTAHWTCSTAAAVVGTTMVSCWQAATREIINILQFFNYFSFCLTTLLNYVHVPNFLGLLFLNVLCLHLFLLSIFCSQKPCQLLKQKSMTL
jgi:hypothetical protein